VQARASETKSVERKSCKQKAQIRIQQPIRSTDNPARDQPTGTLPESPLLAIARKVHLTVPQWQRQPPMRLPHTPGIHVLKSAF
jgi:hypothetical protein